MPTPIDEMTLEQVQATGRDVAGFNGTIAGWDLRGATGRVYLGGLAFVVDVASDPTDDATRGRWFTILQGAEYQSDNLDSIEMRITRHAWDGWYTLPCDKPESELEEEVRLDREREQEWDEERSRDYPLSRPFLRTTPMATRYRIPTRALLLATIVDYRENAHNAHLGAASIYRRWNQFDLGQRRAVGRWTRDYPGATPVERFALFVMLATMGTATHPLPSIYDELATEGEHDRELCAELS